MSDNRNFELQVYLSDHWVTEDFCESERQAKSMAESLLASPAFGGVRILKIRTRRGEETESVLFSKIKETLRREDLIRAAPIEEAPFCETAMDLFKPEARYTGARVLKEYLDKFVLTPTELLHNHREFKRVLDFESLAPSAVSRVAAVQVGSSGAAATQRNSILFDLINEAAERARKASLLPNLPAIKNSTLSTLKAALKPKVPADQQDYYATVVLCRELVNIRSWLGKLETLVDLARQETDSDAKRLTDGIIADIVGSADALRDMLGRQPDLGTALVRAFEIADSSVAADENIPEVTVGLAAQLKDDALAGAKSSLYLTIARQLKGGAKLSNRPGEHHLNAYRSVAACVVTPRGIVGGSMMAEALVLGYQRFVEQGGRTGKRVAIEGSLGVLPGAAAKVSLLLSLLGSRLGKEFEEDIVELLRGILQTVKGMADLAPQNLPIKERMQYIAQMHGQLLLAPLPPPERQALADRIDDLLSGFVIEGKLVERLDDPSQSLRWRATQLVQVCASNALTRPKALAMFRSRVVELLRRPNFDEAFVEDIADEAKRPDALRNFYALLKRAGFE